MDINQAKAAVMKLAASDPAFRSLALSDPKAAIEQVGGSLSDGENVTFSETDLPANSQSGELSDDSLDQAAGGASSTYYCGQGATSHLSRC